MQAFTGLSPSEVKHILKCTAWRRGREGWRKEARVRPKLEMMERLMDCRCEAKCAEIDCKRQRRMLMKLKGGMEELVIETGRWFEFRRDKWICKMCDEREVEDVEHFYCTVVVWQRREKRW